MQRRGMCKVVSVAKLTLPVLVKVSLRPAFFFFFFFCINQIFSGVCLLLNSFAKGSCIVFILYLFFFFQFYHVFIVRRKLLYIRIGTSREVKVDFSRNGQKINRNGFVG